MSDDDCPKCVDGLPAWMGTFADLMSLLMCFFVLLLSMATMDANRFKKMAESLNDAFGVQRQVIAYEVVKGTSVVAQHFSPAAGAPTILDEVRQQTTSHEQEFLGKDSNSESEEKKQEQADKSEEIQAKAQIITEYVEATEQKIAEAIELAEEIKEFMVEEVEENMISVETDLARVVIRIHENGSFSSGSAEFNPEFLPIMDKITAVVNGSAGTVTIAGHTDNIPIKAGLYRSNWELSAARAVTVAQTMLTDGSVDESRLVIEGHADTVPLADNETPENRALNRRVEIILTQGEMPQDLGDPILDVMRQQ
ncbi:MAG: flagellar motor protein MotB [Cycloclasticus sp. symbiont of Bathymodiolus heckerae]|nr:MAG: flagellar motor protein MotB [Cycloclasticus sp. symbiont of Bathymodiolus heckerae]